MNCSESCGGVYVTVEAIEHHLWTSHKLVWACQEDDSWHSCYGSVLLVSYESRRDHHHTDLCWNKTSAEEALARMICQFDSWQNALETNGRLTTVRHGRSKISGHINRSEHFEEDCVKFSISVWTMWNELGYMHYCELRDCYISGSRWFNLRGSLQRSTLPVQTYQVNAIHQLLVPLGCSQLPRQKVRQILRLQMSQLLESVQVVLIACSCR